MRVLVLGDSHAKYFNITPEMRECFPNSRGVNVKVLSISSASIKGFGRRESTLSTDKIFSNEYNLYKPEKVCFALGQVDLELGYFYSKIIKNSQLSAKKFIDDLISIYIKKVVEIKSQFNIENNAIIIKGVNLSTLTESRNKAVDYTFKVVTESVTSEDDLKKYRALLKQSLPSNIVRNNHHNYFNSELKSQSEKYGFSYFDINNKIIDSKTHNLKKAFIPSGNDHHLVDSLLVRDIHLLALLNAISIQC